MNKEYIKVNENQYVVSDENGNLKIAFIDDSEESFKHINNIENIIESINNEILESPIFEDDELEVLNNKKKLNKYFSIFATIILGIIIAYFSKTNAPALIKYSVISLSVLEELIILFKSIVSTSNINDKIKYVKNETIKYNQLCDLKDNLTKRLEKKKQKAKYNNVDAVIMKDKNNIYTANEVKQLKLIKEKI